MTCTMLLLLVAVSTLALTQACLSSKESCTSDCQWTAWSTTGSCSARCGQNGMLRRTRTQVQRGTCSSSKCDQIDTNSDSCQTPCINGIATGNGCRCHHGFGGECCDRGQTRPIFGSMGKCGNIEIVSRSDWGAQPRDEFQKMSLPVKKLFIHHTVTPICTSKSACSTRVKNTQYGHKHDNGWDDIGYNYLVGDDGRAYVGVDWGYVGEHTVGHNSDSVAISAIGNFETLRPSQAILQAIANLIDCALKQGVLDPNFEMFGHKQVSCKACPGKYLYAVVKTSANYSSRKMPIWCRSKWT